MSTSRARRRLAALAIGVGGWLLALAFVRVSLGWSDSRPYEGTVTETRYLLFAGIAVAIALGSTIAAIIVWRSRRP
ncbi:hypothetical protein ARHIZOSPH14_09790 [Agromyces rhizosphaerae]|uniref:Uncharacterized protein n=1 Tax=Agromyces rhizosphaerae TaxID=88374 RepID=A0A9W6CWX3_9MICO|nr:hypothetical protein [Agromyces rhizosphaerae]GLI26737.1 hypothetical protein ARHIZOSPH14_09790 [Agromyces rhizosphaerae]